MSAALARRLAACLAALLLALAPGVAFAQPAALVVGPGEVVPGDLATVSRPILVQGLVEGDVTSLSGPILVEGEVRGDVVSYAGPITLAPRARVGGSVLAIGGGVVVASPAAVAGRILGEEPLAGGAVLVSLASFFGRRGTFAPAAIPQPLASGGLAMICLLLCAVCAAIWPLRTEGAARALRQAPLRSAGLGLLTTLLVALLLPPLAALAALSLVGLPLLIPLLLLIQFPYLVGLAVIGRAITAGRGASTTHPAVAAAIGVLALLLPLALIGSAAPLVSAALFYLVAGAGLGAAILTRGGMYALRIV